MRLTSCSDTFTHCGGANAWKAERDSWLWEFVFFCFCFVFALMLWWESLCCTALTIWLQLLFQVNSNIIDPSGNFALCAKHQKIISIIEFRINRHVQARFILKREKVKEAVVLNEWYLRSFCLCNVLRERVTVFTRDISTSNLHCLQQNQLQQIDAMCRLAVVKHLCALKPVWMYLRWSLDSRQFCPLIKESWGVIWRAAKLVSDKSGNKILRDQRCCADFHF